MRPDSDFVENVHLLDFREHVRRRPGMYIGGVDNRALHNLVLTLVDHVIEQAYLGRCDHVWIELREQNTFLLRDNSPGLPTAKHEDENLTQLEALMQFRILRRDLKPRGHWMNTSMHEVSFAAVNALCEYFEVENYHDGTLWRQKYQHGLPTTELVSIRDARSENRTGTQFIFRPDFTIFDDTDFDRSIVEQYGREIAMLFPGVIVEFRDIRTTPVYETTFQYSEGLKTHIEQLNSGNETFHDIVHIRREVELEYSIRSSKVEIEIAFQFSDGTDCHLQGYANGWQTRGTHLAALRSALLSCINEYMNTHEEYDEYPDFTWGEISAGVAAVISVYYLDLALGSIRGIPYHAENAELFGPIAGQVYQVFNGEGWSGSETLKRIISHHLSRR